MPHGKKIIRQCIGAVKTIGNNCVQTNGIVIKIQTDHRHAALFFNLFNVWFCHISENNQTIHLFFLKQKRHLVFQHTLP